MSSQPISIRNLKIANELRKQGFDSLLDSQPSMRDRFIELWHSGSNIKSARRTLQDEYSASEYSVPSQSALQHYVARHLRFEPSKVTIEPYTPDYTKLMRKYDALVEAYQIAIEAQKIYKHTVIAKLSIGTQLKALNTLMSVNAKLYDMQVQSGIGRNVSADNFSLALSIQQTNINIQKESDTNNEDIIDRFERLKRQRAAFVNGSV